MNSWEIILTLNFLKKKSEEPIASPPSEEWPRHVVALNERAFDSYVRKNPVVIVDFWASWCKPCKKMSPKIKQLAKANWGKIAVGKVNTETNPWARKRFGVQSIPTLLMFQNGVMKRRLVGNIRMSELRSTIEPFLN